MKNIKRLAVVALLGLAVTGLAIAQAHQSGGLCEFLAQHRVDPAAMTEHLSQVFPQVASFDANKDGKLDDTEKEALGKAIADGKFQLPAHNASHGEKPSAETMLNHIAEMYAHVSIYDANHDGELDSTEQAALKTAIEKCQSTQHTQKQNDGAGR